MIYCPAAVQGTGSLEFSPDPATTWNLLEFEYAVDRNLVSTHTAHRGVYVSAKGSTEGRLSTAPGVRMAARYFLLVPSAGGAVRA
jgi:hypothetical protein